MDGMSRPLRTATYLIRFTPEEKAELLWRFYELQQGARARMILVLVLTIVFLLCLVGIGGYLIYTHQLPFLTAMARPR